MFSKALAFIGVLGYAAGEDIIYGKQEKAQGFVFDDATIVDERPLIGVASHYVGTYFTDRDPTYAAYNSYISDATVKWIEASGGRAVPILYNSYDNDATNNWLMDRINGLVFPGGSATSSNFKAWVAGLMTKAIAINDSGRHFPVVGICLGAQQMI